MSASSMGILLIIAAGILNSVYGVPMRCTNRWSFENIWLVYSVVGMGIVSWVNTMLSVSNPIEVYRDAGTGPVVMTLIFGAIWGIANLLFGLAMRWIGIGLAFPISIGLSLAIGTLVPFFCKPELVTTWGGIRVMAGVLFVLIGIGTCGIAGLIREKEESNATTRVVASQTLLVVGLMIAFLSGIMDPFLNFAFAFGDTIRTSSRILGGTTESAQSDAIWSMALTGALLVNAIYCIYRLTRRHTWHLFLLSGTRCYWIFGAMMGLTWTLSIILYGRGAVLMGPLGDSAGWALFYCGIIFFSALWAFLLGEWKHCSTAAKRYQYTGLGLILVAIIVLSLGE